MRAWFLIFTSVLSVAHAIVDQPGFRGSIGTTSTNNYFTTSSNDLIDPTKNSLSYSLGASFRYASGFAIELDFLTSRNKFQSSVTNAVCSSGNDACTYTACTDTSCTALNMTIPGTSTGSSVPITSLSTIMAAATSTSTTSTSSATPPVTSTITTVSGVSSATTAVTDNSGFMTATSLMINGIYQFSPETTLNPYIGYGIGYANATAGLGLTTTPINTTVVTTDPSSSNPTSSSQVADAWTMTSTEKYNHEAQQLIFGSEFRMDLNNTIDIRLTKRYVQVPGVTTLYPVTGSPMPSIGQETVSSSGVMSTTISPIGAVITSIQIGLLYYG